MKELFSYTVNIEKEVEKTETTEQNGSTVTVTKKVKEEVPYRIIIKQPSKKNIEDGGLQFSIEMSNCIKKGILTKGMLMKKYKDTGGSFSEEDQKELDSLALIINAKSDEYRATPEDQTEKKKAILEEVLAARRRSIELQSIHDALFANTADMIARNNSIRWYCLYMTYVQQLPDGDIKPMFPGESLDQKLAFLDKMDDEQDELYVKAYNKLSLFMSFWYMGNNVTKEDLEKFNADIDAGAFNQ